MATKVTVTGLDDDGGWTSFKDEDPPEGQLIVVIDNTTHYMAVRDGDDVFQTNGSDIDIFGLSMFIDDRWRLARPGQSVLIEAVAD